MDVAQQIAMFEEGKEALLHRPIEARGYRGFLFFRWN